MHYQSRFLLRIYILIVVMFRLLRGKILHFAVSYRGFSCYEFRWCIATEKKISFLQSRLHVNLGNSLKFAEIYKAYGLHLIFC